MNGLGPAGSLASHTTSMDMEAMCSQNMLAKPVPMRRLSEKSIAQARASLTSASVAGPPVPSDTMGVNPGFGE